MSNRLAPCRVAGVRGGGLALLLGLGLLGAGPAGAAVLDPGAYASLGTLDVASGQTLTIDIDTNTLSVSGGPSFSGMVLTQPGGTPISVFDFSGVSVSNGATIDLIGAAPLAILSRGDLTIGPNFAVPAGALGGAAGGEPSSTGNSAGLGSGGGGGAGNGGGFGGSGGLSGYSVSYPVGQSYGNLNIALQGGSGGSGGYSAVGGQGGGAVELVASGALTLTGGVSANGESGGSGEPESLNGGGGSGGGIILSGSTVALGASAIANGGAGGGSDGGTGGGGGGGGRILVTPGTYTIGTLTTAVAGGLGGGPALIPGEGGGEGVAEIKPTGTLINPAGNPLLLGNGTAPDTADAGGTIFFSGINVVNNGTLTQSDGFAVTLGSLTNNVGGTVTLSGGSVTAPTATNAGTFNMSGGTFTGQLTNGGTLNYTGGTFAGQLINSGTLTYTGTFTAGNGIQNLTDMTVGTGQTLASNGSGLDNSGTITLAGGMLGGVGPLVNNAQISGYGIISGFFTNNLEVSVGGGNLTLTSTGTDSNLNEIDVGAGKLLILNGGTLSNQGTLTLSGSGVSGSGTLDNDSGGVISGHGTISAAFANNAGSTLLLGDAGTTNVTQAFTNAGTIHMDNTAANPVGGKITNTGTVEGFGQIGSAIDNQGTIRADGGTLQASGTVGNDAGGTIALIGGTFDTNGNTLTNAGLIGGQGTLATGGLTNNGQVSLANGASNVLGTVTNNNSVKMQNATTTFFGAVTNNEGGTITSEHSTVAYLGGFTNSGTLVTDPSTLTFATFTNNDPAAVVASTGDVYQVQDDVLGDTTNNTGWNTSKATLEFVAGGDDPHTLDLYGIDKGNGRSALADNFAWGALELDSGQTIALGDEKAGKGAFYTGLLLLDGYGTGNLADFIDSNIAGDGYNIYYDPLLAGNAYLGGLDYGLDDGGELIALANPVPEPGTLALLLAGIPMLAMARRRHALTRR